MLALNGLTAKVHLHAAAAGTEAGRGWLTDEGVRSTLVGPGGPLETAVEDFFDEVGSEPIDFLKIDIEGGEYPLLADPRFAALQVRILRSNGTTRRNTKTGRLGASVG